MSIQPKIVCAALLALSLGAHSVGASTNVVVTQDPQPTARKEQSKDAQWDSVMPRWGTIRGAKSGASRTPVGTQTPAPAPHTNSTLLAAT